MADQPLPTKEAALFKQLVRCYETKQNKRGLKHADAILKKHPEHGETLAMKGLLLSQQDHSAKKAEAYELVRRAIKNDLKSTVCWHVYGLLCRADRDYLQAIKAYRGALRQDPENVKILRDLSMLQVHMRDVAGFVETRNTLLTLKPTNKINWITFAVAKHLAKDYMGAIGVLEAYENTLKGAPPPETSTDRYEHSEMLLYKNELFVEAGRLHKALAHLDEISAQVVDKTGLTHRRAELMLKLGRFEEARKLYEGLVERNVENIQSHAGLQAATLRRSEAVGRWLDVEVDSATEATLSELYARLRAAHPHSNVVRRLPLDFVRATDAFRELFATYAVPYLRKGVPSLFADIKPLRARPETLEAVCTLADEWLASLEQTGCLPGEPARELPSTIVWTRALVAQLADLCGDSARAFALIDAAIEHTPTCLDLYIVKARVHKHAGNLQAAADVMNTAREMDLQDRYLNTKSTRYMLRADRIADAAANIAPFSSDSNNLSNLADMQCMWYENEAGAAHLRRGEHGKALKNFALVEKHFLDIVEDQYDFHHYCLRKMTLRAYVKMLRLEDELYSQQLFVSAAYGAIDTYLQLDSSKKAVAAAAAAASKTATEGMSAAEVKKAESKRKKAEARAKAEAEAAAKAAPALHAAKGGGAAKGTIKGGKDAPIDDDPDGKLLVAKDAVEGASRYLATLLAHAPNRLRTQTYAVAIYLLKGKLLLALRAIKKIVELARDSPAAHRSVTRFLHAAALAKAEGPVASVISTQLAAIGVTEGTSASQYNDAYLSRAGTDFAALVAWAEMKLLIEPAQKKDAVSKLVGASLATASLEGCKEAIVLLGSADVDAADCFRKSAQLRFPYAGDFQSKPEASVGGGNG